MVLDYLSPSIALHLYDPTQILVVNMTFHPNTLPDLKGKVFIVTGGNSGM
jgi:5,10-methenyltetrahydromethanopterin hydrogenase